MTEAEFVDNLRDALFWSSIGDLLLAAALLMALGYVEGAIVSVGWRLFGRRHLASAGRCRVLAVLISLHSVVAGMVVITSQSMDRWPVSATLFGLSQCAQLAGVATVLRLLLPPKRGDELPEAVEDHE